MNTFEVVDLEGPPAENESDHFKNSKNELKKIRRKSGVKNIEIDCDFV